MLVSWVRFPRKWVLKWFLLTDLNAKGEVLKCEYSVCEQTSDTNTTSE